MLVSSSRQREARGNKVASVYGRVSVAERGREGTVNGRIMSRVCPQSQRVDKPGKPCMARAVGPVPTAIGISAGCSQGLFGDCL